MRKIISTISLCLCLGLSARAQVFILNDNLFQGRMSEITTTVLDSLTNEPVSFASVYVIPSRDTTITNFTLTDAKGEAKLDEVPFGSYVFHVEMMGYKPFVKERFFREEQVDMQKPLLHSYCSDSPLRALCSCRSARERRTEPVTNCNQPIEGAVAAQPLFF